MRSYCTKSPEPKEVQFTFRGGKENQKIHIRETGNREFVNLALTKRLDGLIDRQSHSDPVDSHAKNLIQVSGLVTGSVRHTSSCSRKSRQSSAGDIL